MIYGFARQSNGMSPSTASSAAGTSVRLYLPRHDGGATAQQVSAGRAAGTASTGETVLVVEDEAVVRGVILETLADQGYRTLEAIDGPSGLRILRTRQRIDLLVTDVGFARHQRPPSSPIRRGKPGRA